MIKYISIAFITAYLVFIWRNYGLQKSISQTYYTLQEKLPKYKWLFIATLITTVLLIITPYIYENGITPASIVLFFAGLGIGYTASAAEFKDSTIINTWHVAGAFGGYVLGYVFIVLVKGWDSLWFIVPSLLLIAIAYKIEQKRTNLRNVTSVEHYYKGTPLSEYESKFVLWAEIIGLLTIYITTL